MGRNQLHDFFRGNRLRVWPFAIIASVALHAGVISMALAPTRWAGFLTNLNGSNEPTMAYLATTLAPATTTADERQGAEPAPAVPSTAESTRDGPGEQASISLEPSPPAPESHPAPSPAPNEITPRHWHVRSPKPHAVGKHQVAGSARSSRSPSDALPRDSSSRELMAHQPAPPSQPSAQIGESIPRPPLPAGPQFMPSRRFVMLPPPPPPPGARPPYVIWGPPVLRNY
jgi:hypothetical protein